MSEFMERARAEAEQTIDHMGEGAWADGVRYGIYVGVASASEQGPTDAEVEVVAKRLFRLISIGQWDKADVGVTNDVRRDARSILFAAQKVRAGQ